jgi:hypothetical protein
MKLTRIFKIKVQFQIEIQPIALKITSWKSMEKKNQKPKTKNQKPMMCK